MIVKDSATFTLAEQANIAGIFANNTELDNGGERIALVDYLGETIFDFTYSDGGDWTDSPDGNGPSLTLINPTDSPILSDATNWRPSVFAAGSPGENDSTTFSGDPFADENRNGIPNLVEYAAGDQITPGQLTSGADTFSTISFNQNLATDDVTIIVEASSDLINWTPSPIQSSLSYQTNGTNLATWRTLLPITNSSPQQFLRLRVIAD